LAFAVRLSGDDPQTPQAEFAAAPAAPAAATPRGTLAAAAVPMPQEHDPRHSASPWPPAGDSNVSPALAPASRQAPETAPARTESTVSAASFDPDARLQESARQVSVRIQGNNDQSAVVRLVQRGGDVIASVRGSDASLVDSLRGGLPALTSKLESHDLRVDVWQPAAGGNLPESREDQRQQQQASSGGGSREQQAGGGHERRDRDHQHPQRPAWLDQLEGVAPQMPRRNA
jgi:hypothetical protein